MRILLVEDDEALAPLVVRHLSESGFAVRWAKDATKAWDALEAEPVDLVILDIMLPGEDGLSLCRRLRRRTDIAVVMVSARGQESDRIFGLDLGADDYLPKPFSLWELEARIKAVLRRYGRNSDGTATGPFVIDLGRRSVTLYGRRVDLTRSEFDLLALLSAEPGRVFPRDRLLDCIRGGETDAYDRAVDAHISNLRRKIETDPKSPLHLKTVWGIGYCFEP